VAGTARIKRIYEGEVQEVNLLWRRIGTPRTNRFARRLAAGLTARPPNKFITITSKYEKLLAIKL
jgi:hypothetical protein